LLNVDVVITISALRTLANNTPPFSEEWEMPMTIKEVKGKSWKSQFTTKARSILGVHSPA